MQNGFDAPLADECQARVRPHQILSDKYELLRVMSSGGMGSIWAAQHLALDNQVAIKLLHEKTVSDELRERLVQEARLSARVVHRNIVRILDLGFTERKAPYVVMELLDGRDLGAELAECGRLPPVRAVQLLLPVLDGLVCAHEHNIVHRDLKPENIFLERSAGGADVVPKIVDFGIARCMTELGPHRITSVGSVFGTPHYLSPEQALGRDDVDHRADIWGLCAVLYQCVTGQPPFGDRQPAAAIRAIIMEDVPPPSQLGVDDEGLEPLLMRGLRRDREQRWPDAQSLGQALCHWLTAHGVQEDASARSVRPRWFGSVPDFESQPPPSVTGPRLASRTLALTQRQAPPPTLRRSSAKWFALAGAALLVLCSVAAAGVSARQSVSELRRLGNTRLLRANHSEYPMEAAAIAPAANAPAVVGAKTPRREPRLRR
jgi:serine/threonine protein kinase